MSKVSKKKGLKTNKKQIISYDVLLLEKKEDVLVKTFKELKYTHEYVQKNGDKSKEYGIRHTINGQIQDCPIKDSNFGVMFPHGRCDLVCILFFKNVWKSKSFEY